MTPFQAPGARGLEDRPGYLSPDYAASLGHVGAPLQLPGAGGWLLKRPIPGCSDWDATGCYPMLCCADWSRLAGDLAAVDGELVSVTAVADPYGDHGGLRGLAAAFPDLVQPFKEHYFVDLRQSPQQFISPDHRRYARRALAAVQVESAADPQAVVDDWSRLYGVLIDRHGISGVARFSRESFKRQLAVPGVTVLQALEAGQSVGMSLWYRQGERVYYHLGACSERGYEVRAAYAMFRVAIDFFAGQGVALLGLGAGAGLRDGNDGLTRFKRGWATGTRTAYLCGRVCKLLRYAELARTLGRATGDFFPAYRATEWVAGENPVTERTP